jgi:hypothetical protein
MGFYTSGWNVKFGGLINYCINYWVHPMRNNGGRNVVVMWTLWRIEICDSVQQRAFTTCYVEKNRISLMPSTNNVIVPLPHGLCATWIAYLGCSQNLRFQRIVVVVCVYVCAGRVKNTEKARFLLVETPSLMEIGTGTTFACCWIES